ncbi:NRDE family protein [Flavobacteriaceae bacterium XHP0103]|uniref:NRDE family protein n=1 Tax=Marixanthotalea marina TaxID=2844359 RepID=UPI00298A0696|nr:NRDE family protein [Marixanthotalea marina]MBU3822057.1 NRDE family protein [Marixanthotalea marina]
MCTVTIIPKGKNGFVLTSNRDEDPSRQSLNPDFYLAEGVKLLYPKDEMSGGTWVGISEKNRCVCILNGGFEKHERKPSYRKSRGVVAKDFLIADAIETSLETYNLNAIEPFTMLVVDWNDVLRLFELVWDGEKKHIKELSLEAEIWSSSTLYSDPMKKKRKQWFETFKKDNELTVDSLLRFHKSAGENNDDYGVIMDRGFVKTTSITQVIKADDAIEMHYENLQNNQKASTVFNLRQTVNE